MLIVILALKMVERATDAETRKSFSSVHNRLLNKMGKHSKSERRRKPAAEDNDGEWVEKPSAAAVTANIPTAASLAVTGNPNAPERAAWMSDNTFDPHGRGLQREDYTDGFGAGESGSGSTRDFFESMGSERKKLSKELPREEVRHCPYLETTGLMVASAQDGPHRTQQSHLRRRRLPKIQPRNVFPTGRNLP
jgi:hypothetical protein